MPMQVLWPRPGLGRLEDCLVGQGPGARHDAHRAGAVDIAWHDADLALPGVMTPGQFGPMRTDREPDQCRLDSQHVQHRNALGDADDDADAGIRRLQDGIRREGRRARRSWWHRP